MPSSDKQARQLAQATTTEFAAWRLEERTENQLLLCPFNNQTRSWLMTEPEKNGASTRLFFGSAVNGKGQPEPSALKPSRLFKMLTPIHCWYSVALLSAAAKKLSTHSAPPLDA